MPKRKRSSAVTASADSDSMLPPLHSRRTSQRKPSATLVDPSVNGQVFDAPAALRASPDSDDGNEKLVPGKLNGTEQSDLSMLSDAPSEAAVTPNDTRKASASQKKATKADDKFDEMVLAAATRKSALKENAPQKTSTAKAAPDPEAEDDDEDADPEEIREALSRPPPVNSDYLPLPWKGRLGYACLCTYLRNSNPPVFQSRTTRIASILEHRHPLADPSQPEHPTKNRPDKEKPADVRLGQRFVEQLCIANCRDMVKMLRWNEKYNIKFLRLSSEAFPFASHAEYGYKLAPFASEALAEVGRVAAELGHRLTTHPGQFTQLGSPRKQVIDASIKDLEYHSEMLSLLKLPPQQDRDAVMVLHMGGMFGDKAATLDRFRENYARLNADIKKRLVLENDDMCWSVHDLLPICKELNIPLVLDFHHHNIIFDNTQIREGTKDIIELFPEIRETWTRKGITQKMHYSEPTPPAVTPKQRRKHNPRPATLPPCPNDMDLMIEAKDKEQAVFELMRTFKLPGFDRFSDIQPHIRRDDNKPVRIPKAKATPKKKGGKNSAAEEEEIEEQDGDAIDLGPTVVPDEEIGMGGPEGRVYWPPGMEEWLRPVKKVVKKKGLAAISSSKPGKSGAATATPKIESESEHVNGLVDEDAGTGEPATTGLKSKAKSKPKTQAKPKATPAPPKASAKKANGVGAGAGAAAARKAKAKAPLSEDEVLTDDFSDEDMDEGDEDEVDYEAADGEEEEEEKPAKAKPRRSAGAGAGAKGAGSRTSGRATKRARFSYKEEDDDDDEE